MNELMLFDNDEFGKIRGKLLEDLCWFVGRDVIRDLGYEISKSMSYTYYINKYCSEDDIKKVNNCDAQLFGIKDAGRKGELLINEYALYDLIFESPLPSAKAFKSWVTHEVLPSIRKTGKYEVQDFNEFPELLNDMNQLVEDMKYKIEEQDKQIEEIKHLVGIRAKDVFDYGKIIKEHLGISKVNKDYNIIKEMFFYEVGVSKWEDLNYSRNNVKLLIDICNDYKPSIQINMFED
ncbi:MAG: Bro-N domain-containing protein [Clostridia bacterium]